MKIKYLAAILIGIAALGLQQATASDCQPTIGNTCTSILSTPNSQLHGTVGPYGTVTVHLVGQTATITFTAAAGYFFVDGGAAAVNVNSTNFSHSATATETPNDFKNFQTNRQEDGFGRFNLAVNNKTSSKHVTSISFTVTNLDTSNLWVNASDVLIANAQGWDAAAHVFSTAVGLTGYVGEGAGSIPDGGTTVMLLGMALGALGMARRFLRS